MSLGSGDVYQTASQLNLREPRRVNYEGRAFYKSGLSTKPIKLVW